MSEFEGKVAIVTGAGGGIGRCHAIEFAQRGAKVVVNDLGGKVDGTGGGDAADQVVADIEAMGGTAIANKASVSDRDGAGSIVEDALSAFGRVDILVNNAGILRDKTFKKMTLDEWDIVVNVHLNGSAYVTHAAWPHMYEQRYGRVVFTSSGSGIFGNFGQSNYGAAKMGIVSFIRSTADALVRYNVTSNGVFPGAATRMTDNTLTAQQAIRDGKPLPSTVAGGTPGDPFNNAPIVTYLASEAGGNITGRMFGSSGWTYRLYSDQSTVRHLYSPGPWDMDKLFEQMPQTLAEGMEAVKGFNAADVTAVNRGSL